MRHIVLHRRAAMKRLGGGGKTTFFKHIREGRLIAVKIGGRTFVTLDSVEKLIEKSIVANP